MSIIGYIDGLKKCISQDGANVENVKNYYSYDCKKNEKISNVDLKVVKICKM